MIICDGHDHGVGNAYDHDLIAESWLIGDTCVL